MLARAGEGMSSRAISAWLLKVHGLTIAYASVGRFLAKQRDERAVIAKAVTRDALKKTVLRDIDVLGRERTRLMKVGSTLYRNFAIIAGGLNANDLAEGADFEKFKAARIRLNAVAELADSVGRASERLQKLIGQRMDLAGAGKSGSDEKDTGPTVAEARDIMKQLFGETPKVGTDSVESTTTTSESQSSD